MGRAAPAREDRHQERGGEEQGAKDGGRPRERVRLAAAGHETAGPPARPERAALGALQEDDHDERDDDQDMNNDQNGLHEDLKGAEPRPGAGVFERWRAPNMAQGGRPSGGAGESASAVGRGDGQKFRRFQARAADQRAIDIVEGQKFAAIARLDRPAIEEANFGARGPQTCQRAAPECRCARRRCPWASASARCRSPRSARRRPQPSRCSPRQAASLAIAE